MKIPWEPVSLKMDSACNNTYVTEIERQTPEKFSPSSLQISFALSDLTVRVETENLGALYSHIETSRKIHNRTILNLLEKGEVSLKDQGRLRE